MIVSRLKLPLRIPQASQGLDYMLLVYFTTAARKLIFIRAKVTQFKVWCYLKRDLIDS